jgi:hypothetical protein
MCIPVGEKLMQERRRPDHSEVMQIYSLLACYIRICHAETEVGIRDAEI